MTPKQKAIELLKVVRPHTQYWDCYNDCPLEENHSKKCALICIEEMILLIEFEVLHQPNNKRLISKLNFLDEVKREIEKL